MSVSLVTMRTIDGVDYVLYRDNDDPTITTLGDATIYFSQQTLPSMAQKTTMTNASPSTNISITDYMSQYGRNP